MKRFCVLLLTCILILCSCRPIQTEETAASGKVTGLIDNHTVEMMLSDGSIKSFLFYDEAVGESLSLAEDSNAEITVFYVEKEGQQLCEIIRVE